MSLFPSNCSITRIFTTTCLKKLFNMGNFARLLLFGFLLTSCCAVPLTDNVTQNREEICQTSECVSTASTLLNNMDLSVNPCDNFYSFACGNFVKSRKIPDDEARVNMINEIVDTTKLNLRKVLEVKNETDLKTFKELKKFYDLCMDENLIEEQGKTPLLQILKKLGEWPVILGDEWKEESFNWLDVMTKHRKLGFSHNSFLSVRVSADFKNSSKFIIEIDQASLEIPRKYLIRGMKDKHVLAYLKYMVDLAVLLGVDVNRANAELTNALIFEIKLANITLPSEERRNASALYNVMTVRELTNKFPAISWKDYINELLYPVAQVSDHDVVNVAVPKFISDLLNLLNITKKRVLANYATGRLVASAAPYLTNDMRKAVLDIVSVFTGRSRNKPRWNECISYSSRYMPLGIGALFARNFFHKTVKRNAEEMVSDIRNAFQNILKEIDWMDDETKKSALEKAVSMIAHIAYPEELLDDNKVENYHAELTINPTNFLEAAINLTIFETEKTFKRFRKPFNKTDWIDHGAASVVNAFYSPTENSIQFPAGILQGLFFNGERPNYMNYGGVGSIIGHEITHGFDDQGRDFDKDGNLVDWWNLSTKSKFLIKAQCIIDQYSNYTVKEINLNLDGINTQGENIADNGGIKEAYFAYNAWVKRNGIEPQLPGLNYTGQQMFWISAANALCTKHRPEDLRLQVLTDPHSPEEFRVIGPFANRPEFAADFNCSLGSKMNPVNKCSVW